jgi:hypothetical protein
MERIKPLPEGPRKGGRNTELGGERPDPPPPFRERGQRLHDRTEESDADLLTDLRTGLRIDKHALDDALIQQPELYREIAELLPLEISRKDAAKLALAQIEAIVDAEVREDARKAGDKITEKEIDAQKTLDKRVVLAQKELIAINRRVGEVAALRASYEERSKALEGLIHLYKTGYWNDANRDYQERRARDHTNEHVREEMSQQRKRDRETSSR